jgi:hypothetical protein
MNKPPLDYIGAFRPEPARGPRTPDMARAIHHMKVAYLTATQCRPMPLSWNSRIEDEVAENGAEFVLTITPQHITAAMKWGESRRMTWGWGTLLNYIHSQPIKAANAGKPESISSQITAAAPKAKSADVLRLATQVELGKITLEQAIQTAQGGAK